MDYPYTQMANEKGNVCQIDYEAETLQGMHSLTTERNDGVTPQNNQPSKQKTTNPVVHSSALEIRFRIWGDTLQTPRE